MHRLDSTFAIFFGLAASFACAQQPLEADECVVARAAVGATANGALDLRAFGPSDMMESHDAKRGDPDASLAPNDSTEALDAHSIAPLDESKEQTAPIAVSILSKRARSIVPKGQSLTRDAKTSVPWYRTPYLALLAVLGLIVVASVVFKRWVPAARQVSPNSMRVLGRVALAAKHSAVLLHVGRRVVLVGVSADSVSALAEIRDPDEMAALLGQSAAQTDAAAGFEKALAREIEAYPENAESKNEITPVDEELLEKTQGQLHGLLSKLRAMQSTPSA